MLRFVFIKNLHGIFHREDAREGCRNRGRFQTRRGRLAARLFRTLEISILFDDLQVVRKMNHPEDGWLTASEGRIGMLLDMLLTLLYIC